VRCGESAGLISKKKKKLWNRFAGLGGLCANNVLHVNIGGLRWLMWCPYSFFAGSLYFVGIRDMRKSALPGRPN